MSFVEVSDVGVRYFGASVLERVNLSVDEGAFVTIVGASGCGKSTFLRLLLSQERPTSGSISVEGTPLPPRPTPDRGIVFQRYSVFPHLTVTENLILPLELERSRLFGRVFGPARQRLREEVEATLEHIGLAAARARYPAQLSGGMQQRLAIAQALLKKPRMLLLDEPFGALDPGIRRDMHELLLSLWNETGMTIFMVTHDIAEAFKLGTRLIVFDKLRAEGSEGVSAPGASITYDLPLRRPTTTVDDLATASVSAADALDRTTSILSHDAHEPSGETS
jgi:NitT/TauT family transport system ATP-binding protein